MKIANRIFLATMLACTLGATAGAANAQSNDGYNNSQRHCKGCGTVMTTNRKDVKGSGTGKGAVVGGVAGAIGGNLIGHNTTGTLLGAGAGALIGNQVEKNNNTQKIWSVQVRMDNGSVRNFDYESDPQFHEGDRVRANNGTLDRLN